ncbi:hypothetical protein A961_1612 [Enterococcus faecalis ATCC 29212]|nr:hypothetical protein A961_1612 [Enterococcus faecalis ATCC 29212]
MTVQLTYETGSLVTVNVPVTVEDPAKKLDLSQLQTVYASIGEANQYTVYSWQLFTAIGPKTIVPSYYQQATQLLAEGQVSGDKTQEQVDQLTSNLQSAMKVLVKKADITLERAEAENELASVHKLDESVYTTDSWQAMQEALIDTTTGEGSSKQLQQLLAWSDEELLEPILGGFKTPADAQKRINQLTQTIKTALLLLVEKSTETTSNTSESSTSSTTSESSSTSESSTPSTTSESSSTSESSTSSTTSETSNTNESNTPSTTSKTSSTSESSASSTTSATNSTSESSTPSTLNENSQSKGQNSVIYAVESNQDPNDAQSNSKPSAKASQTKESVAENQATKQIQTNKESSGTVKKADNTTKIAKKKFPKTGEQSSAVGSFLGLSFLSLAIATYCFKVKR